MSINNVNSHRNKKINKQLKEKGLIALGEKSNRLHNAKWAHGGHYVEAEEPLRSGWQKTFSLREDIRGRKDFKHIQSILSKINTVAVCKTKDFKRKNWKTGEMEDIPHEPKDLTEKQWLELPLSERRFFAVKTKMKVTPYGSFLVTSYVFSYPWMLVPKVTPHYLTHFLMLDADLESEIARTDNKINVENLRPKINKAKGVPTSGYGRDSDSPKKHRAQNKLLKELNEEE